VRRLAVAVRRLRDRPEDGFTLLELTVALLIMGVIAAAVTSVLYSVQRTYERESYRSQSNDQARLAVEQLDREIRSGNLLYDPDPNPQPVPCPLWVCDTTNHIFPGMALLVYTQNNATSHSPGNRCVQWRIYQNQLQVRDWSPEWRNDGIVDAFRVVADNVLNQSLSPQVKAFQRDTDQAKGGRAMKITVIANVSSVGGSNVTIQQEITGRDTEYGYPSSVCVDIPPY